MDYSKSAHLLWVLMEVAKLDTPFLFGLSSRFDSGLRRQGNIKSDIDHRKDNWSVWVVYLGVIRQALQLTVTPYVTQSYDLCCRFVLKKNGLMRQNTEK